MTAPQTFKAAGPLQADWVVAPCELVTLQNVRLNTAPSRPMEYELVPAQGEFVQIVQWKPRATPKRVNFLATKCNLDDLAQCANGPRQSEKILRWVSTWGLLGFRHAGTAPSSYIRWINPGRERFFGPEHRTVHSAEPLALIVEAARVAQAAIKIYDVLAHGSIRDRATAIQNLITQDASNKVGPFVRIEPDGRRIPHGRCEMETWVNDVFIGKQLEPRKPVEYDQLAVAGLGFLTNAYLGGEFQLYWSENANNRRRLEVGWSVNSLLAGLYLKLGYSMRKPTCIVCGFPIAHRRAKAKTCGAVCRKRLQRLPSAAIVQP